MNVVGLAASCVTLLVPALASAQEPPCGALASPSEVVRCALSHSAELLAAEQEVLAKQGQRQTASALLPTSPGLAITGAERWLGPVRAHNGSITLNQEVDVAGQRGLRLDAATAAVDAEQSRFEVARQWVAARALVGWLHAIAARDRLALAQVSAQVAAKLRTFAEARTREQLVSAVDARLAAAESVRLASERFEAQREANSALLDLGLMLGLPETPKLPATVPLAFELPPTTPALEALAGGASAENPAVKAAEADRASAENLLALAYRQRIPRLTISGFAQKDGFDENVVGFGLAAPIPLPGPIWPGNAGNISQQRAKLNQAELNAQVSRKQVRIQVQRAVNELQTREAELALFTPDLITNARKDLDNIATALQSGQLSVRDALLAQRSLLDLLQAERTARLATVTARVELLRAAALPFPGAVP